MTKTRKRWDPKEKFQIVLELLQGRKTQAEITSEYGVAPTQQNKWKEEFLREGARIFQDKRNKEYEEKDKKIAYLERKVGQYAVETDWLQKKIDGIRIL